MFKKTLYIILSDTQTLEGFTSLIVDSSLLNPLHYVFWDLEKCTLKQAEETLKKIQQKYDLSHIYIVSDSEGSYRAWCFSKVIFKTYLHILLDTEYVDPLFFKYTVKRDKATLRVSNKIRRPCQKIVSVLQSYFEEVPERMEQVVYDTGLEKKGLTIILGDKNG